jgi:hypothetical protein
MRLKGINAIQPQADSNAGLINWPKISPGIVLGKGKPMRAGWPFLLLFAFAILLILPAVCLAVPSVGGTGGPAAPEIDADLMGKALALVIGGLALLRSRLSRQTGRRI